MCETIIHGCTDYIVEKSGEFSLKIKINFDTIDENEIDAIIDQILKFLDILAISINVGIKLDDLLIMSRLKGNSSFGMSNIIHKRLTIPNEVEISQILMLVKNTKDERLYSAAHGLNSSYVEQFLPSRVSFLWATIETIFRGNAEPLFSRSERKLINAAIKDLDCFKPEDEWRLSKFKEFVANPDRLPLNNRNKRISENICHQLGWDYDTTYRKIREISTLRGQNLHNLSSNWEGLRDSEIFLQNILKQYIVKKLEDMQIEIKFYP